MQKKTKNGKLYKISNFTTIKSKFKKNLRKAKQFFSPKISLKEEASTQKSYITEYYDLPYGYNKTVIKLLAQTPNTLFVYWELSQDDVQAFIEKYGVNFFYETYPVLSVYNEDMNYYFDVNINDYANSWYIHVPNEDCRYTVKFKRVFKEPQYQREQSVDITVSNSIIIPNGHVVSPFKNSGMQHIEYMNWKTKKKYFKDVYYYNKSEFYKSDTDTYQKEFDFNNPSSNFNIN